MTQLESARKGVITPEMRRVAVREGVSPERIRDEVAIGRLVIPANIHHLAGSGGETSNGGHRRYPEAGTGHPSARADAMLWFTQSMASAHALGWPMPASG